MTQPPARARQKATAKTTPTATDPTAPQPSGPIPGKRRLNILPQDQPHLEAKIPLWQKLADDLRVRIEAGELPAGQLLPSETDLMAAYGASRPTARRAIAALRAAGLVVTEHGRGTRVRPNPLTRISNDTMAFNPTVIRDERASTFTTWDTTGWTDASEPTLYHTTLAHYGDPMRLSPDEPVFIYQRHLRHTSAAQILHRAFVPFALAATVPSLETDPAWTPSALYQVLTDAGFSLHWNDSIRAQMPTPDDIATLVISEGVPMLIHTRLTVAADQRPLILEETRLPADRATIMTRPVQ